MNYKDAAYELLQRVRTISSTRRLSVTGQVARSTGCSRGRAHALLEELAAENLVLLEYQGPRSITRATIVNTLIEQPAMVELDLDELRLGVRVMISGLSHELTGGDFEGVSVFVTVNGERRDAVICHLAITDRSITTVVLQTPDGLHVIEAPGGTIMEDSNTVVRQALYLSANHAGNRFVEAISFDGPRLVS